MLKKATQINPGNYQAFIELGICYKKEGKPAIAEKTFKEAIEKNPGNARLYAILALLHQEQGKYESAEEYFKKADILTKGFYTPMARRNYQKIKKILIQRKIKLVCMQYPMRSVEPLKKMLEPNVLTNFSFVFYMPI